MKYAAPWMGRDGAVRFQGDRSRGRVARVVIVRLKVAAARDAVVVVVSVQGCTQDLDPGVWIQGSGSRGLVEEWDGEPSDLAQGQLKTTKS